MSKQKYYAVKKGKTRGIFFTWEECKESTSGFPGAVFKSFPTRKEAEAYLRGEEGKTESQNEKIEETLLTLSEGEAVAFVDGSFDAENRRAGYGVILIDHRGEETELSGAVTDDTAPELIELRNVAAELMGAEAAVERALSMGMKKLTIYYDYAGIGCWADGSWEAKKDLTKDYVSFLSDRRKRIGIDFIKVPAHTGVRYNERVDALAKKAIDIEN